MIAGILLGLATAMSMAITIYSAPKIARRFIVKHPFITDLMFASAAWILLSSVSQSALSAIGAAIAGLFISFGLLVLRLNSNARDVFARF